MYKCDSHKSKNVLTFILVAFLALTCIFSVQPLYINGIVAYIVDCAWLWNALTDQVWQSNGGVNIWSELTLDLFEIFVCWNVLAWQLDLYLLNCQLTDDSLKGIYAKANSGMDILNDISYMVYSFHRVFLCT